MDNVARGLAASLKAANSPTRGVLLRDKARATKGVIGTSGKAAVAFRFDDWQDSFETNIYPLLTARGIPASMVLITRFLTSGQPWCANLTWDKVRTWNRNGIEVWSHGTDHKDPSPIGYPGLYREIVESKADIEAQGIKCQGWALPGTTPLSAVEPFNSLDLYEQWDSDAGRLITQTYPYSETYLHAGVRNIPTGPIHGASHVTISDAYTLANAKLLIDEVVNRKLGVELMTHSGNLGLAGNMTLSEWTQLLDYIVAYWDAGQLEIVTPSGLMYADPGSTSRIDLIADGTFSDTVTPKWTLATGRTISVGAGVGGTNALDITSTTTTLANQRASYLDLRGLGGETFIFEGWARSNGASTTAARLLLQDYDDTSRLNMSLVKVGITNAAGFTRVRWSFTLHPLTQRLSISLGRNSGDGIQWSKVSIKKV